MFYKQSYLLTFLFANSMLILNVVMHVDIVLSHSSPHDTCTHIHLLFHSGEMPLAVVEQICRMRSTQHTCFSLDGGGSNLSLPAELADLAASITSLDLSSCSLTGKASCFVSLPAFSHVNLSFSVSLDGCVAFLLPVCLELIRFAGTLG